jgi:hypothetical protein
MDVLRAGLERARTTSPGVLSAIAAGVVGLVVLLLIAPRRRSSTEGGGPPLKLSADGPPRPSTSDLALPTVATLRGYYGYPRLARSEWESTRT